MEKDKKKSISEAEAAVMEVLWKANRPLSAFEIRTQLNETNNWERTTVLTLIRRLLDKDIVSQEKREVYYYTPKLEKEEYVKDETQAFVKRIYQGQSKDLIAALFRDENLTAQDIDELRSYFNESETVQ